MHVHSLRARVCIVYEQSCHAASRYANVCVASGQQMAAK